MDDMCQGYLPLFVENDYIDDNDNATEAYRKDFENNCLAALPSLVHAGVHTLVQSIFDESILDARSRTVIAPG